MRLICCQERRRGAAGLWGVPLGRGARKSGLKRTRLGAGDSGLSGRGGEEEEIEDVEEAKEVEEEAGSEAEDGEIYFSMAASVVASASLMTMGGIPAMPRMELSSARFSARSRAISSFIARSMCAKDSR